MNIKQWFIDHQHAIAGVTAIIGIVVAIIGFGLTIWQINRATAQLQASNEYSIRRDLRDLVQKLNTDFVAANCIQKSSNCLPSELRSMDRGFGLIFNFHYSVYLQGEAHGISEKFERQMAKDFCRWFQLTAASELWDRRVKAKDYGPERVKMRREWCK